MVLWIRSQDRQDLMAVSRHLHIQETSVNPHSHKWGILLDGGRYIGEYNSEERALEVLDEIQKIFKPQSIIKDSGKIIGSFENTIIREGATYELKELSTYVYEMPQE